MLVCLSVQYLFIMQTHIQDGVRVAYLEIMQMSVGRLRLCDLPANLICDIFLKNSLHWNFSVTCLAPSELSALCVGPGLGLPQGTRVYMKQLNSTCIYVKLFALCRQLETKPTPSGQQSPTRPNAWSLASKLTQTTALQCMHFGPVDSCSCKFDFYGQKHVANWQQLAKQHGQAKP